MRSVSALGALLFLLASLAGCATVDERGSSSGPGNRHLIFNPRSSRITPIAVARGEWPAAKDYSQLGEDIVYQVRIIDWQGRVGDHGDTDQLYYRRFSSTRTGAARR